MNMSEEILIQHTLHRHSHWCHSQWVIWCYWRCRKHRPPLALSHRRKTCRIETTHWQYHRGSSNHGPTFGTAYVLIALEDLRCSKSGGSIPGRRLVRYCFIALPLFCETAQYHNVQKKSNRLCICCMDTNLGTRQWCWVPIVACRSRPSLPQYDRTTYKQKRWLIFILRMCSVILVKRKASWAWGNTCKKKGMTTKM